VGGYMALYYVWDYLNLFEEYNHILNYINQNTKVLIC
jgi:hypothetical protein